MSVDIHTPHEPITLSTASARAAGLAWQQFPAAHRASILRATLGELDSQAELLAEALRPTLGASTERLAPRIRRGIHSARIALRQLRTAQRALTGRRRIAPRSAWHARGVVVVGAAWPDVWEGPLHDTILALALGNAVVLSSRDIPASLGRRVRDALWQAGAPRDLLLPMLRGQAFDSLDALALDIDAVRWTGTSAEIAGLRAAALQRDIPCHVRETSPGMAAVDSAYDPTAVAEALAEALSVPGHGRPQRIFVARDAYPAIVGALAAKVQRMPPLRLPPASHLRALACRQAAVETGARVRALGESSHGTLPVALLTEAPGGAEIWHTRELGPTICIAPVDDLMSVSWGANWGPKPTYGSIWSATTTRQLDIADAMQLEEAYSAHHPIGHPLDIASTPAAEPRALADVMRHRTLHDPPSRLAQLALGMRVRTATHRLQKLVPSWLSTWF